MYNTSSKPCQDTLSTQNTSQRTPKQSDRLPILRRKCAADLHCKIQQIPMVYEGTSQIKYLIQLPPTRERRCQLAKRVPPCITHPINRVRIPYQHRTHLNILRQGPRHLPDNNKSLHESTTHHSSVAEDAIFQQNRCCSKSKRSTTDPKTQNALPTDIARYNKSL